MLERGFRTISGSASTDKIERLPVVFAFACADGRGNPAGIVYRDEPDLSDEELVGLCRKSGLPTLSYVVPKSKDVFQLRWITPTGEFDLCGHGTMAASGFLFDKHRSQNALAYQTRSGLLEVRREGDHVSMKFPRIQAEAAPASVAATVDRLLGEASTTVLAAKGDLAAIVESDVFVRNYDPDIEHIKALSCRGFSISAPSSDSEHDIVTRTFMPNAGIDEDQVCISAHCKLFGYWRERFEKSPIKSYQASSNGGQLNLAEDGDDGLWVTGLSRIDEAVSVA